MMGSDHRVTGREQSAREDLAPLLRHSWEKEKEKIRRGGSDLFMRKYLMKLLKPGAKERKASWSSAEPRNQ